MLLCARLPPHCTASLPPCLQEIKAARLQHKLLHKSVAELQRNASAHYAELGADVASLAARLALLPAEAQMTEEQLAVRVDALVKAHLLHVSSQMMALQAALASSGEAGGRGGQMGAETSPCLLLCIALLSLSVWRSLLASNPPPSCCCWPRVSAPAAKQQHALLCFLAMLGGVLALNGTHFAQHWPRAKWAVLLLAAANGLVGVALQLHGSLAQQPRWLEALPWPCASSVHS